MAAKIRIFISRAKSRDKTWKKKHFPKWIFQWNPESKWIPLRTYKSVNI